MIKQISIYLLLLFMGCLTANAQQSQNRDRIAILGLKRFEFQSDYNIKEIMEINKLSSQQEVFELYNSTLINCLSIQTNALSLFRLPKGESNRLHQRIPIVYKEKPINHLGADLRYLKERNRMNTLLSNLSADYLLVLVEYKIKSAIVTSTSGSDGSKFIKWSTHQLSYELYNKKAALIAVGDKIDIEPDQPRKSTANSMGVDIKLIKDHYKKIIEDLSKKIKH